MEQIDENFVRNLCDKPKVVGICGNTNEGKSMLVCNILKNLVDMGTKVSSYGLRVHIDGVNEFFSIGDMEQKRDEVICIDEFYELFELEDRKKARQIERVIRLINHRNNILILCGTPDNFKKFISNQLNVILYKTSTIGSFINGSSVKNICMNYRGFELGVNKLVVEKDEFILYDNGYKKMKFKYIPECDTKASNVKIVPENVEENVQEKKVTNNVREKCAENVGFEEPDFYDTDFEPPELYDINYDGSSKC